MPEPDKKKKKGVTMTPGSKEINTPGTFKAGIMLDPVSFNLDKSDINTATQLDAMRSAILNIGKGGPAASRTRFAEVRNITGSNISSFSATSRGGMTFRLHDHVSSLPGKTLGGTFVMDSSGNISNTQGKNVAVSPYFSRIGVDPKI